MQIEYYYILFLIFAVLAYFIVTDNSIAQAFVYLTKLVELKYRKTQWWLLHNPSNPVVKYFMWRRSIKLGKQLQKEFDKVGDE